MLKAKRGTPTPQEARQDIRQAVRHSPRDIFYASFEDVPHEIDYKDGEVIWVYDSPVYDMYVFKRSDPRVKDSGTWYSTNVSTGAAVSGW